MRHARGIAAYDPLAVPITFALDRHDERRERDAVRALAATTRRTRSASWRPPTCASSATASPAETSTQKYDEGAVVVRPNVFLGEHFGVSRRRQLPAAPHRDAQYPARRRPAHRVGPKLGVMPYFSPAGRGSFKRPQFRLLYVASFRDAGARALYPAEDVFAQRKVEHFLGIGAEWWFNSSSYP